MENLAWRPLVHRLVRGLFSFGCGLSMLACVGLCILWKVTASTSAGWTASIGTGGGGITHDWVEITGDRTAFQVSRYFSLFAPSPACSPTQILWNSSLVEKDYFGLKLRYGSCTSSNFGVWTSPVISSSTTILPTTLFQPGVTTATGTLTLSGGGVLTIPSGYAVEWVIPWLAPILVTTLAPAFWLLLRGNQLRRSIRQTRRAANGLCLHCGYDLRATIGTTSEPARCPECGMQ